MKEKFSYDNEECDISLSALTTVKIAPLTTAQIASLSSINGPYPSLNVGAYGSGSYSIGTSGSNGSVFTTNGSGLPSWATMNNSNKQSSLNVKGDAEFEGKVKVNGQDLGEFMETISKRLAILVPDPAKLEHFEALKKAYNHYKMLEKLCELPTKEEEK